MRAVVRDGKGVCECWPVRVTDDHGLGEACALKMWCCDGCSSCVPCKFRMIVGLSELLWMLTTVPIPRAWELLYSQ